jgi:hypothetical protein
VRSLALLLVPLCALANTAAPRPTPAERVPKPALELITAWLAAQNEGSFAAYSALYAPELRGVRRSGTRTVVLDHAGWLKDRERMQDAWFTIPPAPALFFGETGC